MFTPERLEQLFNVWMERYTANPSDFNGPTDETYGKSCVDYLTRLDKELT